MRELSISEVMHISGAMGSGGPSPYASRNLMQCENSIAGGFVGGAISGLAGGGPLGFILGAIGGAIGGAMASCY